MDENVILTKLVQMELCVPAFRPHVKTKQNKKKPTVTHERNFKKMINDGLEFEPAIRNN